MNDPTFIASNEALNNHVLPAIGLEPGMGVNKVVVVFEAFRPVTVYVKGYGNADVTRAVADVIAGVSVHHVKNVHVDDKGDVDVDFGSPMG